MTMITPEATEVKEEIDFKMYTKEQYDTAIAIKDAVIAAKDKVMEDLRTVIQELRVDGDKIAAALREEAEDRDWCESYNTFVQEVNSQLKHLNLEPLSREYNVEVTVTRTQSQRISVSIYAINEDVAMDEFYSSQDEHADVNLRDDEWQDDNVEYEVERVDEA